MAILVKDTYTRTIANHLGSAEIGNAYFITTGQTTFWSAKNAYAQAKITSANRGTWWEIPGVSSTTIDMRIDVSINTLPVGGSYTARVSPRYTTTDLYNGRLTISSTGTVTLRMAHEDVAYIGSEYTLPGTYTPGDVYTFRMLAAGTSPTTLKIKAWKGGSPEPDWQIEATDATPEYQVEGHPLVRFGVSGTETAFPTTNSYNLLITDDVSGPITPPLVPTSLSGAAGYNDGTTWISTSVPSGAEAGDLVITNVELSTAGGDITDWAAKGWWLLDDTSYNTRETFIFARIYNPSDSGASYTFTQSPTAAASWASALIRTHGVQSQPDLTLGSVWTRVANGGSQTLTTAPSVTTTQAESLVIAALGEAANSATTYSAPAGSFELVAEQPKSIMGIDWPSLWQKPMPTPGATGDFTLTYDAPSNNGYGVQIIVPPGVPTFPTIGQISVHAALQPSSNSFSIGAKRLSGTTIAAQLRAEDGETVLDTKTYTFDETSGWGSVRFTGLTSNTTYVVRFIVDTALQIDALLTVRTLPTGPTSFVSVTGSCQFTASNHVVFDKIREEQPLVFDHQGDLQYADATNASSWRTAIESSLNASRFKSLLETTFFNWAPDNHDRIITNTGGAGSPLNMGTTDPQMATEWKKFAGTDGFASADTVGRTWVIGRVRFIHTDQWTVRDDPDNDPEPRTFLGAAQKQWFKDTLETATEPLIIWSCHWTCLNNANGRWNSFPSETSELEAWFNAHPDIKRRTVLIGGDSHSLQADDGTRGSTTRFKGMPNLNVSGFNRAGAGPGGDGSTGIWAIANASLYNTGDGTTESNWGAYSKLSFTDSGSELRFRWDAIRVKSDGTTDTIAWFERSYGQPFDRVMVGTDDADAVHIGEDRAWKKQGYGSSI